MLSRSARSVRHISRALLACACAVACALVFAGCSKNEPPSGTVRYETEDAVVNMGLLLHGYTWDNATADVYSPNEMADDDVPDIEVPGATEVSATFSENVRHAEVWRYLDGPEGESVECDYAKEVVSFEVVPAVSRQLDHEGRKYVQATYEGYEDILVTVEAPCTESDEAIVVGGGYEIRVGTVTYIRGEGYMASGPIVAIEREVQA